MPLSDKEQQILDELEKQLFADDPRLASSFSSSPKKKQQPNTRKLLLGIAIIVAGLGLLVFSVSIQNIFLGVISFLIMIVGAVLMLGQDSTSSRIPEGDPRRQHPAFSGKAKSGSSSGFMKRLEQRWDRRSRD